VVNEPVRRCRLVGTDLIPIVAPRVGVDVFGIDGNQLIAAYPEADLRFGGNLSQPELWNAVAHDRVYLHLNRWTSLGLSLIEAMLMAMPVAVLAMTEAATLPQDIGAVSSDPCRLRDRVRELVEDPDEARRCGLLARAVARERFGLAAFLRGWDEAYDQAVEVFRRRGSFAVPGLGS
jgi:glycosyltransferase involved in cell wall biosynthesis